MRVWVARAEPAAGRTAEHLRRAGHEPLVAPVMGIVATGQPVPDGAFDAVLLTSANAVCPLADAASVAAPIFAVGERTAARAREAGFADVIAAEGDAAALCARVRTAFPVGASLLLATGEDRKPEPEASLRDAGYRVWVWPAYAARSVDRLPEAAAAALSGRSVSAPLDAALHYSRRSAALALALVHTARLEGAFRALKHYCLSADVAVPLVEAAIPIHFVPPRPEEAGLLDGLGRSPSMRP